MLRIYDRKMFTSYCFSTKKCLKFINTKRMAVQLHICFAQFKDYFFSFLMNLFLATSSASLVCSCSYVAYIANNIDPDQIATLVTLSSMKKI